MRCRHIAQNGGQVWAVFPENLCSDMYKNMNYTMINITIYIMMKCLALTVRRFLLINSVYVY